MKVASLFVAGLAVAISSITPANAAANKCSSTTWPMVSAVQCAKPLTTSYSACQEMLRKKGWEHSSTWWYCSSQGFKS